MAEIRKYIRDKNGNQRGVVVATDAGQVGWSVAHPRDRFDKELGLKIARGRAAAGASSDALPGDHRWVYQSVLERSNRYFQ